MMRSLSRCLRRILLCVLPAAIATLLGSTVAMAQSSHASIAALSQADSDEIDEFLRAYHDGVVVTKTIPNTFGQVLSCVDVHHQPALNSPTMKGHKVQLEASAELKALLGGAVKEEDYSKSPCAKGEVAIVFPTREQIVRFGSLKKFLSKHPHDSNGGFVQNSRDILPAVLIGHEYAAWIQNVNATASLATFNVWQPSVGPTNETSITQSWLAGWGGGALQTVEVGVHVYPQFWGDSLPHWFVYYTADGYVNTHCYDTYCPSGTGFVQTSTIYRPDIPLQSSVRDGPQVEGPLGFYRDPTTHNWILYYFDGTNFIQVGYYPVESFIVNNVAGQLTQFAEQVSFGGEVGSLSGGTHTTAGMGSGAFASEGWRRAAYQRNLRYMDTSGVVHDFVAGGGQNVTNPNCYSISSGTDSVWGTYMYFGGPGLGPNCP